jgi:PRTRC genetic system protein E
MNEQSSGGLMQALAPIATRRPVHIIVSAAAEGALHVVCQPLRVGNDEDPELGRGFSVEAMPAELDADLSAHVARSWVPAHQSLQSVLDQVAAHAEQARQATLRKQKEGKGKKEGAAGAGSAQTTLAPPPADAAAPAPAPDPAPAPAPDAPAPAAPVSAAAPEAGATGAEAAPTPAPAAAAEPALAGAASSDGISSLFD